MPQCIGKGSRGDCNSYHGINLLSVAGNVWQHFIGQDERNESHTEGECFKAESERYKSHWWQGCLQMM